MPNTHHADQLPPVEKLTDSREQFFLEEIESVLHQYTHQPHQLKCRFIAYKLYELETRSDLDNIREELAYLQLVLTRVTANEQQQGEKNRLLILAAVVHSLYRFFDDLISSKARLYENH
jgi:hypothetical protein